MMGMIPNLKCGMEFTDQQERVLFIYKRQMLHDHKDAIIHASAELKRKHAVGIWT